VSILCEADTLARLGPADDTHHLVVCCLGVGPHRPLAEGTRGLHAPSGRHRQILQVDRGPTSKQHQVRTGGGVLHQHHPSFWGPELHHHRQRHPVHRQKVPGLRQAMDEGAPLGGLESEDDAEPSHGLHTVLSSLWGRGHLAHRLRIWFPEDEGLR
jgi:hypothetical protein